MAEYCLDCYNKYMSEKKLQEKDVIMEDDLCEGCGLWKPCMIVIKERNILTDLKDFIVHMIRKR